MARKCGRKRGKDDGFNRRRLLVFLWVMNVIRLIFLSFSDAVPTSLYLWAVSPRIFVGARA